MNEPTKMEDIKRVRKSAERCWFCSCESIKHDTTGKRPCKLHIGRCVEYEPPISKPSDGIWPQGFCNGGFGCSHSKPSEPPAWEKEFDRIFVDNKREDGEDYTLYLRDNDIKAFIKEIERAGEARRMEKDLTNKP